MNIRPFDFLHVSIAFILACSDMGAQICSAEDARAPDAGAHGEAVHEEDSQASRRVRLEKELERLNGSIADTPSRLHHRRAEVQFRLGRFHEALRDYDKAIRFGWPHDGNSCWERGLALYYAGDFAGGGEQFALYHRVGSLDIENGIWRFLCTAEAEGIAKARETIFEYPRKVRKPFPALLALYLDRGSASAVLEEARRDVSSAEELLTNLFYAHYYLGKYFAIVDQETRALSHLQKALEHRIPHFMYACAEIDAKRLEDRQDLKTTQEIF